MRPHYHALVYGQDFATADEPWRVFQQKRNYTVYTSPVLEELWGQGHVTVTPLTYETAAYCAKYSLKKRNGSKYDEEYLHRPTGVIRRREFAVMSRNPGIGASWLKRYKSDVYPEGAVTVKGRKFRPPRFYDDQLTEVELEFQKARRRAAVAARKDDLTDERLYAREKITEAKQALSKRNRFE